MTVLVVVPARDEAQRVGAMLLSLEGAVARAAVRHDISDVVVAHACTDGTCDAASAAIAAWRSPPAFARITRCDDAGGKVHAIVHGVESAGANGRAAPDVVVVVDADVVVPEGVIVALVDAVGDGAVVASAPRAPLPPQRRSILAKALHRYNHTRGFGASRQWFNGRCYATRRWDFPSEREMNARARSCGHDDGPLLADDVWLSRVALRDGPGAIVEVAGPPILYRAPETLFGMCQHLRRLRREVGRIDALFPELPRPPPEGPPHLSSVADVWAFCVFRVALSLCRLWLWWEAQSATTMTSSWNTVPETKAP